MYNNINKKKNFFHSKIFIIIMVVVLILSTTLFGTYAWLTWRSTDNATLTTTIGDIYTVTFENGADINATLLPVYNYTDGYSTTFSITSIDNDSSGLVTVDFDIGSIDSALCDESIKYVLVSNNKIVGNGDLSGASADSTITILSNSLLQYGTTSYTFYLYMDGNIESDIAIMNKEFDGELSVSVVDGSQTAGEYINSLYLNSTRTDTVNNVTGNAITYSYASSVSLMKDRLGGTETQESGNLRYYGSGPDNYIYFNCSDYDDQNTTNCELWRIIGVFNGKLKIIRSVPFSEKIAWDYDYNDDTTKTVNDYQNTWSTSSLQSLLNNEYLNGGNTSDVTYWSFTSGATNSVDIDIDSYQIKNTITKNKISTETWYLNPITNTKAYADSIYATERATGGTTWSGKVGLVSASDYAYSMDFSVCNAQLGSYATDTCKGNSWLTVGMSTNYWTMASGSGTQYVYTIKTAGAFSTSQARIGNAYTIRPVIYLNANTKIISGTGTSSSPYKIG